MSDHQIQYIAEHLNRIGISPTDSAILRAIRDMNNDHLLELIETGKILMWEEDK